MCPNDENTTRRSHNNNAPPPRPRLWWGGDLRAWTGARERLSGIGLHHAARHRLHCAMRSTLAWLLPFTLLVFAIVAVPLHILDDQGLPRYRALRTELLQVQQSNEQIRRHVRDLQQRVERLRSDPVAVEQVARDELGMLRQDELLFQF
jgi:cell division protein FtsB